MTPRLLACAALLALATPVQASDEQLLADLTVQWMTAVAAKDKAKLEALTDPEYALQFPGDTPDQFTKRDEWIANSLKMDWRDFRYENIEVRVHGDTATVSSRLFFSIDPIPFTADSDVVDTWTKRDGTWKVTRRYLGQSRLQERFQFVKGAAAALVLVAALLVGMKLVRRVRARRA